MNRNIRAAESQSKSLLVQPGGLYQWPLVIAVGGRGTCQLLQFCPPSRHVKTDSTTQPLQQLTLPTQLPRLSRSLSSVTQFPILFSNPASTSVAFISIILRFNATKCLLRIMATLATGGNPRPPGEQLANSDAANTIPGRGLAHLVSKFETLDKGTKPSFPHQVVGLTTSKTMSSLSSLQHNRLHFEKGHAATDGRIDPSTASSPVVAAAAALGRTSISSTRSEVAQPNRTDPKDRVSRVAEKRKIFEADATSFKEKQGVTYIRFSCLCILTMAWKGHTIQMRRHSTRLLRLSGRRRSQKKKFPCPNLVGIYTCHQKQVRTSAMNKKQS